MSRNTTYRTFNLTNAQLEKLERLAAKEKSNVNAVMRRLIDDAPDVRKPRKAVAKPKKAA